jgi:hypothetical protein
MLGDTFHHKNIGGTDCRRISLFVIKEHIRRYVSLFSLPKNVAQGLPEIENSRDVNICLADGLTVRFRINNFWVINRHRGWCCLSQLGW